MSDDDGLIFVIQTVGYNIQKPIFMYTRVNSLEKIDHIEWLKSLMWGPIIQFKKM